jgi:hypothetical protein
MRDAVLRHQPHDLPVLQYGFTKLDFPEAATRGEQRLVKLYRQYIKENQCPFGGFDKRSFIKKNATFYMQVATSQQHDRK